MCVASGSIGADGQLRSNATGAALTAEGAAVHKFGANGAMGGLLDASGRPVPGNNGGTGAPYRAPSLPGAVGVGAGQVAPARAGTGSSRMSSATLLGIQQLASTPGLENSGWKTLLGQ